MKHSHKGRENFEMPYPDMKLWQEIIYLQECFEGDWCVENVITYYDPLIEPQERGKHYFWSNFYIPEFELEGMKMETRGPSKGRLETARKRTGFDLSEEDVTKSDELKMLNNAVTPELGKHIFDAATKNRQTTLL
jgi:DNA (cytosine-5)-methyltransferase 1